VNGIDGRMTYITLKSYLDAMERIFLIENLPAWNPHLRSRTALTTAPKWHFTDPSIALSALGGTKDSLLKDYETFGLLFESLCVRDLRVYSQRIGGRIRYLRNRNGFEVDIVLELPDGRWGGIEVKLGSSGIDRGAENLLKLKDMIDTDRMKRPSFLMVLTAGQSGYTRKDGVVVVPIGCLRD
jgi:predicted AAA+ superfamily ATPase